MFWAVLMYFSPYLGLGRRGAGGQTRLVHNVLVQFFTVDSSIIEVSKACFFLKTVITSNDRPKSVRMFQAAFMYFSPYWGIGCRGGGGSKGACTQPGYGVVYLGKLKIEGFRN